MQQIIGLTGYAGAGKDEAAKALIELGWLRVSFADPIREMLLALNPLVPTQWGPKRVSDLVKKVGWDEAKKNLEIRCLLQRLGTEAGRDILGPDIWVDLAEKKIDATDKNIVITDVRFPNEVQMVHRRKGYIVEIGKDGVGPINAHSSDNFAIKPHCTLWNNGTIAQLHANMASIAYQLNTREPNQ